MSSSTKRSLDTVYNTEQSKAAMLDTQHLFQPRGPGTSWHFRLKTPRSLVGTTNPHTNNPFGTEIRIGLGTHDVCEARKKRDVYLGIIRAMEIDARSERPGSPAFAAWIAAQNRDLDDDARHAAQMTLEAEARALIPKIGEEKASRYYRIAMGYETPGKLLSEVFKEDREKRQPPLSVSTINNLKTVEREFLDFAGAEIELLQVKREKAAEFVDDYLPQLRSPKAPNGPGPATIAKKVTLLRGVWEWAKERKVKLLPMDYPNPWDKLAPSDREIEAAKKPRRPFNPNETVALFAAEPEGTALGDIIRVALLTGVRLEEIASLEARQIDPKARWYNIAKGKTKNAARVVPLVDMAQRIVLRRLEAVNRTGPLFPELPLRKSTDKRGGVASQRFTKLRRKVLGRETDGSLRSIASGIHGAPLLVRRG